MSVQNLTIADFKKQIMDFEANPQEWKYLGGVALAKLRRRCSKR